MGRKPMTEAHKAQARENLAKARAARQANQNKNPQTPKEETVTLPVAKLDELLQRLEQLEQQPSTTVDQHLKQSETVSINTSGQTVGIITKFPIEAKLYPDPRDDLYELPELRRFSPRDNIRLVWEVTGQVYETKFGTNVQEPFFKLDVNRLDYDEEGELKPQSFRIARLVFNEDETEALKIAQEMGLSLTMTDMREIMNLARVERIKRWLLPYFLGHKIPTLQNNSTEQVDPQTGRAMQMTNTADLL